MPFQAYLLRTTMLTGVVGGIWLSTLTARADDLLSFVPPKTPYSMASGPAVDGVNANIDGFGGMFARKSIAGSKGSLTLPFGGPFGAQLDGAVGSFGRRFFGSAGGHLFLRDPSIGLVGAYASHTHWNRFGGVYVTQVGAEAEYYWQRWTVQGVAGVEFGNYVSGVTAINPAGFQLRGYDVKTRFFDRVNLSYYITDDFKAYVGHRYLGGKHALAVGGEYGLPLGRGVMASAFVEGRVSSGDFNGVWGGLRVYFGQHDKPLIARNRMDDPINWSPDTLFSIVNSSKQAFIPQAPNTVMTGSGGGAGPIEWRRCPAPFANL